MKDEKSTLIKYIKKDFLIIVIIAIIAISAIFTKSYTDLDEIWNFNFAQNISRGLIPYKDFNMINTPFLGIICGLVLKIFESQLIVMRVMAVILMCLVFGVSYKIIEKLLPKTITLLLLAIILALYKEVMRIDYNYATLLIALITLFIELKNIPKDYFEYSFKYNFLIGLLAGTSVLFKQSVGAIIVISVCGYKILGIRKKEEIKTFLKIAFTRLLGALVPLLVLTVYLVLTGALSGFISYAILGIKTFSNRIPYTYLLKNSSISSLAYLVPLFLIIMFVMTLPKKVDPKKHILFAYSISTFSMTFPISDEIHFLIGSLITIISAFYIICDFVIKTYSSDIKKEYKEISYMIITFISTLCLVMMTYTSSISFIDEYIKVPKEETLKHFSSIPKNEDLSNRISLVDKYIENQRNIGKNVYILDSEAALYFIPLDIYNKDYDMFQKGNLGKDGEDGIIDKIENEENAIYLLKEININWQHPQKVHEYITNNLRKVDEISYYDVYTK